MFLQIMLYVIIGSMIIGYQAFADNAKKQAKRGRKVTPEYLKEKKRTFDEFKEGLEGVKGYDDEIRDDEYKEPCLLVQIDDNKHYKPINLAGNIRYAIQDLTVSEILQVYEYAY